ncbi:MAG: hypothetical protein ACJ731_05265 [Vicinamibacterales bacterium]
MVLGRHLAAFVAILSLCVGHVAVCAGWQATPAARMACCTNDEVTCPMHQATPNSHGMMAQHTVDQVQADSCCAGSERTEAATTFASFAMATSIALVPSPLAAVVPALMLHIDGRRAALPLAPSPVPRHLLLSVFLV